MRKVSGGINADSEPLHNQNKYITTFYSFKRNRSFQLKKLQDFTPAGANFFNLHRTCIQRVLKCCTKCFPPISNKR